MDENLAAALCYFPIIGLIFLLIEPYKRNKTVRFNALQSLLYCGATIVLEIVFALVIGILAAMLPFALVRILSLLSIVVYLGIFLGYLFLAFKAYQRQHFALPLIGAIAEKNA